MMHRRGRSDPGIVAVKPANKAAPTAAELVEQRTGAKGNASQQSTCRAQDRESVSQALERIRQVARERKKERFTALFHHISIELLGEAFYELKEDAAPGVDRMRAARPGPPRAAATARSAARSIRGRSSLSSPPRVRARPRARAGCRGRNGAATVAMEGGQHSGPAAASKV